MTSVINEYLKSHKPKDEEQASSFWLAPRVRCADGFSMSVQVHAGAYCDPRNGTDPDWYEAEIGFPSERPSDAIMGYAESPETPTDTVYGYVPLDLIDTLIAEHGGLAI